MVWASFLSSMWWLLAVPGSPPSWGEAPNAPRKGHTVSHWLWFGSGSWVRSFWGLKVRCRGNFGWPHDKKCEQLGTKQKSIFLHFHIQEYERQERGDWEKACKEVVSLCCSEIYLSPCGWTGGSTKMRLTNWVCVRLAWTGDEQTSFITCLSSQHSPPSGEIRCKRCSVRQRQDPERAFVSARKGLGLSLTCWAARVRLGDHICLGEIPAHCVDMDTLLDPAKPQFLDLCNGAQSDHKGTSGLLYIFPHSR